MIEGAIVPCLPTILTAAQCRAARAMIEWSAEQLSEACGVDLRRLQLPGRGIGNID